MIHRNSILTFLLAAFLMPAAQTRGALATVWSIGRADNDNAEFALAPRGYSDYSVDGFFVVGESDPGRDWPYAQPGPSDAWAGSRQHINTILFGLDSVPSDGECRLTLDFIDTHNSGSARLAVKINGQAFEKSMPSGAGDDSIMGDPGKGREFVWSIPFAPGLLKAGNNQITITSAAGSWVLYDAVMLELPENAKLKPVTPGTSLIEIATPPVWLKSEQGPVQPAELVLRHIGEPADAVLKAAGVEQQVRLVNGLQTVQIALPASESERDVAFSLVSDGKSIAEGSFQIAPPRLREIWILPHSHVDIGYTHRQDEVIDIQIDHLFKSMDLADASSDNPPGMRYKWNPEAVWSLDHYLQRADQEQRDRFLAAVRRGDVGVDALYGNMLTALCRPEELAQCLSFGAQLSNITGVPVESAAICDVPGWTWGIVPIMAQAGVKYFAIGPNFSDRIGRIHVWDNKPFYWEAQSGVEKVLCWIVDSYWHHGDMEAHVRAHIDSLVQADFPYDSSFMFWVGRWDSGAVDNAPPDELTVEKVIAWNEKYAAPQVKIGLAGDYFRHFEEQNREKIPAYAGDLTPYWEDGAGSTSRETGMNRGSADRLSQASALFAMRRPADYPAADFAEAWKNVLLYSEHTWGAWCSISQPDSAFTLDQWRVKQAFALDADLQSRALLDQALPAADKADAKVFDVFNTTQWIRTDLAVIPADWAAAGIRDSDGRAVPAQRLADGSLAFMAVNVPAFGARRYEITDQETPARGRARIQGSRMSNGRISLELNPETGAIRHLHVRGADGDFVDPHAPVEINDFRYLLGVNPDDAEVNGPVTIEVIDPGPLVATVQITSDAPGCEKLVRRVRMVDGLRWIDLVNVVDRKQVREKDAVHFGFGFRVPDGQIRMETPWAVVRPDIDQLDGANRNWYTVQRWIDVSNEDAGITCAPVDAPLMQIGGMTANLLGAVAFDRWMTEALDSQILYSWAQNNHWHTNYKADQPGTTTFRYVLRPHAGGYSAEETARFGVEVTRPLLVAAVDADAPLVDSLLRVSSDDVLVETVKPSEDGRALIVRLFGVTDQAGTVRIDWNGIAPTAVSKTDLTERPLAPVNGGIEVPGYGVVMLRAEMVR